MWIKWLPWRYIISRVARAHGFLDPVVILSNISRFAQPSEVLAPVELLRLAMVLHARGLINSQVIQHNLDWIWPYWVERQFDPRDISFVPRAFSLTHINLTHRDWTAIGLPGFAELPIVDPRGAVTPFFNGWSLDCIIVTEDNRSLIPPRVPEVKQSLTTEDTVSVTTVSGDNGLSLSAAAEVVLLSGIPFCRLYFAGKSGIRARMAISLRPCNPEGISFVDHVAVLAGGKGWRVNGKRNIYFDDTPSAHIFSDFRGGDVLNDIYGKEERAGIKCGTGLATAAAVFDLDAGERRPVTVTVPLVSEKKREAVRRKRSVTFLDWRTAEEGVCRLDIPEERFKRLFDAAIKTGILHSPKETYAGPYTYKHFWFRDAVYLLQALMCVNLMDRAERIIDVMLTRQTPTGYFYSQRGEWDSNGQVLWVMRRFCELSGTGPKEKWINYIHHAAKWIVRKRFPEKMKAVHAGLMPAGFSAEHFGPNDYYYWDNFWSIAGLEAAAYLLRRAADERRAERFLETASSLNASVKRSLEYAAERTGTHAMPSSPYRRMDSSAVGSLAADYPLKLWEPWNTRVSATVEYLLGNCFIDGGFFHEIAHSGINAYLTLGIAQVLLRGGDGRFAGIMKAIADFASPTGQWPEAINPRTKGGCMGDGQHVWAAAEWIMMIRNCFVREEESEGKLILCSGIIPEWCRDRKEMYFGTAPTSFGDIDIRVATAGTRMTVSFSAEWHDREPLVEVRPRGLEPVTAVPGKNVFEFDIGGKT